MSLVMIMSEKELIECRQYFWDQDQNRDGQLSWDEFDTMCSTLGLGLSESETNTAFNSTDQNRNGYITFGEFLTTYFINDIHVNITNSTEAVSELSPSKIIAIREYYDKKDKLSRIEFVRMVSTLGIILSNDELHKAFGIADGDKDGQISFEEFTRTFLKENTESNNSIPVEELEIIRKCFDGVDGDANVKLDRNELSKRLESVGIELDVTQLNHVYYKADENDGTVSFQEFVKLYYSVEEFIDSSVRCHKMSEDEIVGFCKYFWYSDKDADGKLSPTEFLKMLDVLGMKLNEEEINRAFGIADVDGDGMISFNEFANAYLNTGKTNGLKAEQIKEFFYKFDKDNNGILSKQECLQALQMLGNKMEGQRLEKMMELMDENHDDNITLDEFCAFLQFTE